MVFIVLEGIDGCGKTTQAMRISEWLRSEGRKVYLTVEPTCGKLGVFIRHVLSGEEKVDPKTLALLFSADRSEHLTKEVEPALAVSKIVVSERYYYSTIAYQAAQGVDASWIREINSFARKPDLTLFLDVEPVLGAQRSSRTEIFENKDFLKKVRKQYLSFKDELTVIPSEKPVEEVFSQIQSEIKKIL